MRVITNFSFSVIFKTMANIWRVALIRAAPSEPPITNKKLKFVFWKNNKKVPKQCMNYEDT